MVSGRYAEMYRTLDVLLHRQSTSPRAVVFFLVLIGMIFLGRGINVCLSIVEVNRQAHAWRAMAVDRGQRGLVEEPRALAWWYLGSGFIWEGEEARCREQQRRSNDTGLLCTDESQYWIP